MKRSSKILLIAGVVALFASCAAPHYARYNESSAYYLDPHGKGFVTPMMSDVTVDNNRIAYEQVFVNNLTDADVKEGVSSAAIIYMKNYTLTQAAFANDADIIVFPLIDVKTSDDLTQITVKLTGYPGHFSNFRKATKEDFDLIRISENEYNLQKLEKKGIVLPPCMQHCGTPDECPVFGAKHHPQKEVTPVNLKEAKFTIEKEK